MTGRGVLERVIETWENTSKAARCLTTERPLTHTRSRRGGSTMQATRKCSITGCNRPYRCSGYCKLHYDRTLRLGTPHLREIPETCTIDGCDLPHAGRGYCSTHWLRWRKYGDPGIVNPNPANIVGPGNPSWAGDDIAYTGLHQRLRRLRGPAANHPCVECGEPARAWSYDHQDPDERIDAMQGVPYSVKPAHYQPRCGKCHWRLDHQPGKRTRV